MHVRYWPTVQLALQIIGLYSLVTHLVSHASVSQQARISKAHIPTHIVDIHGDNRWLSMVCRVS